jgi:hypothetical protein
MSFVIFGIVMAVILVIALAAWCSSGNEWYNIFAGVLAVLLGIFAAIAIVFFCIEAWDWKASGYKAEIINREYGTSYTREEVFYGSDVIDTIRQLDRTRVEVNGNVMHDKE